MAARKRVTSTSAGRRTTRGKREHSVFHVFLLGRARRLKRRRKR